MNKSYVPIYLLLAFATLVILLSLFMKKKGTNSEGFKLLSSTGTDTAPIIPEGEIAAPAEENGDEVPLKLPASGPIGVSAGAMSSELLTSGEIDANVVQSVSGEKLVPKDLLPKDSDATKWAAANPLADNELKGQNFLDATFHNGVNTVGQSLRNANLQLRSEPANPTDNVSPWLQTSIEPDLDRKPLE